jgi:integration host factor subunit alpha
MTLAKHQLVEDVSKIGFTKRQSSKVVESLLEIIKRTLVNGEDVLISGFGKFCIHPNGKRLVKNGHCSMDQLLSSGRLIRFRCSPVLSRKINDSDWGVSREKSVPLRS